MKNEVKTSNHLIRVSGKLKEVVTFHDDKGNIMQRIISPIMVEFYARDAMQIVVGASILAIPVAFTEETWNLGASLPTKNVFGILLLSCFFISIFVYYNFYRDGIKNHWLEFIKRTFSIYLFSFLVVALILTLIQRAPWEADLLLAVKRAILVSFPASMSAAVADMIK